MSKKRAEIPVFDGTLIETHCHLDYLKQASIENILAAAADRQVHQIITIAVAPDNLDQVRDIARNHVQVWCTQGIHPHEAESYSDSVETRIVEGLADEKVVAVGEIGLDYYYDNADRAVQRSVFSRQLRIAAEHDLPVVIHTREADEDTIAILREYGPQLARKGVIHSFTSTPMLAEFCLDQGFCLGFNGIITFNRADNVRAIVELTPLERILLETDSPFLTPVPYRGKENAPFYLPFIAQKVADIKEVSVSELLPLVARTSRELFRLPNVGATG